jgi:undecaprenyl-diphosphatase
METADQRIAWFVLVSTIPAGIIGLAGENAIADHLGEPWQILNPPLRGSAAPVLGRPLAADANDGRPRPRQGARHGLRAGLALAPGVSRSGITITAGRFMKLDRDSAARFSFYLLIPDRARRGAAQGTEGRRLRRPAERWGGPFVVGTLAALGSGLLAIEWLLGYVRRHTYGVFVLYRLVVAAIVLLVIATGLRDATF